MINATSVPMDRIARRAGLGAAIAVLFGCATEPVEAPRVEAPPPPPPVVAPPPPPPGPSAATCTTLQQRGADGVRITQAEYIAAGIADPLNGGSLDGDALPAHCRVAGRIELPAAASGEARSAGFELRLPTAWNQRLFFQADGDAEGGQAIGRNSGNDGTRDNALARGFAVVAGIGRPALETAADASAGIDTVYVANERIADAARALLQRYYHRGPKHSYLLGCGDGGRQGILFAQRNPRLFDGIVAVAPGLRSAEGAAIAAAWTLQRLSAVAPRGRDRKPVLSKAFSREELFRVADAILAQCDALDGAADGLVQDMAGCRFDTAPLACARGRSKQCLSAKKLEALNEAMAGPRNAAGQTLYTRWPWDPGIAAPGWRAWTLGDAPAGKPADARHVESTSGAIGLLFATPPDAGLGALNFDFERDPARLQAAHRAYDVTDEMLLTGFRQHGGRLLMFHGAADPVFSAWATVEFQQRLNVAHGAAPTAAFARTFVVPGMNHCAGGPATDRFDALAAIVGWVESDRPPERIEARGSAVLLDETRPLCPWPQIARYQGAGATSDSASYACR
jgi:feruloyl esterase